MTADLTTDLAAPQTVSAESVAITHATCKLIQLSDLHLPAQRHQRYRDRDVEQHLLKVLEHIACHHADLDGLLLTGDLVQYGQIDAYRRLVGYLERLDTPWCWIPGNHDQLSAMRQIRPTPSDSFVCNGWRVVLLDSTANPDGQGGGELAESELQRLGAQLDRAQAQRQAALLVLHHNPVAVGSAWQDAIMLGNAERFWQLLGRYRVPITVLFGHIHQPLDATHQGVRLLSCPSTSVQFVRQQRQLTLETDGEQSLPGYRWLVLPALMPPLMSSLQPQITASLTSISAEVDQTNPNRAWLETGIEWVGLA